MNFLWSLVLKLPQLLLGLLNKAQDTAQVQSNNAKDVTVAALSADTAHFAAVKDVTMAMFSHPIFWVAWGLGVFPVLSYHSLIFFVSTFPYLWQWATGIDASHAVLRVPTEELSYGQMVVGSVFTLTGASTLVAGLTAAWTKRI
jgi:hypothetical protein